MEIRDGLKLDFDDVLIVPKSSTTASRSKVKLIRRFKFYHSPQVVDCCPVITANMDTTGTLAMAMSMAKRNMCCALKKQYLIWVKDGSYNRPHEVYEKMPLPNTFYTCGMEDTLLSGIHGMIWKGEIDGPLNLICLDVANGYTNDFLEHVAKHREAFPNAVIMAGNVCTPNMVERLIDRGVDIVKIGIGPGSVCTTRLVAGVGYPQLSAIIECADAAHGRKSDEGRLGLICADGGCKTPGDICKAFCAGADFVMIGGMLAGTDECDGEWEYEMEYAYSTKYDKFPRPADTQWFLDPDIPSSAFQPCDMTPTGNKRKAKFVFYGMSSYAAQDKHKGRSPHGAAEGKRVVRPYLGPADNVLQEIEGGLRSCCAYIGATEIKYMRDCGSFVRVTNTHNRVFE